MRSAMLLLPNYIRFSHAIVRDDYEMASKFISDGVDLESALFPSLSTALILAAEYGRTKLVKLLIEKGADVNAQDYAGWTALHNAAQAGNVEMMKLLLENGADIKLKTHGGVTAGFLDRTKTVPRKAYQYLGF